MITYTSEDDLAEKWKALVESERKPVFDDMRVETIHSPEDGRIMHCLMKHGELTANDLSVKLSMSLHQVQQRVEKLKKNRSIRTEKKIGTEIYSVRLQK